MNWKTFFAILARDAHVARRNFVPIVLQTMLQPMLFVFVFGRVMTQAGFLPAAYKSLLVPGIMAITMVMTGIQAVAMPLIGEFQFTREIEDRLLAPMRITWFAVEKIVAGMMQSLVSGLVVIPAAWLMLRPGIEAHIPHPIELAVVALLVALLSSAGGLTLGCSIGQTQIGLMFSLVLAPMIFFGCAYYPWSALAVYPLLQKAVLLNPLVYASEGLRGALTPQFPHLSLPVVMAGLLAVNALLLALGLRRFHGKAIS
ncbi:MAG: ABC transporter permease [Acidobacteria bacterium]|nr:ABC transporter permease [Acidobacteriota bacterium]